MKRFFKVFLCLCFSIASISFVTSCGGGESSDSTQYYDYTTPSYSLHLNNPHAVTAYLSNKSFVDSEGNRISFGSSASSVSLNGTEIGGAISVNDFGTDEDNAPYAIFTFSTPYGNHTFFLTELDEDYGGRLPSRIVIYDVNDPSNLYYKK